MLLVEKERELVANEPLCPGAADEEVRRDRVFVLARHFSRWRARGASSLVEALTARERRRTNVELDHLTAPPPHLISNRLSLSASSLAATCTALDPVRSFARHVHLPRLPCRQRVLSPPGHAGQLGHHDPGDAPPHQGARPVREGTRRGVCDRGAPARQLLWRQGGPQVRRVRPHLPGRSTGRRGRRGGRHGRVVLHVLDGASVEPSQPAGGTRAPR